MNSNLVNAIRSDNVAEVLRIVKSKEANNAIDNDRPIRWASSSGHADIVKTLLEDPSVDPSRGLRVAVKNGHVDVVKELIKDERIKKLVDEQLVKLAKSNKYDEIANLLLKSRRSRSLTPPLPPSLTPSPPLFHTQKRKRSRSKSDSSSSSSSLTQSTENIPQKLKTKNVNEIVNEIKENGKMIGKGAEGDVYLYDGLACKIFKHGVGDSARGRNIYFIQDYGDTGVVPKFHYVEKRKWKVLCMEYLEGYKTLKHLLKQKPDVEKRQALFDAIIKARKLLPHDVFFNDFRNPGNIMVKELKHNKYKIMFIEGGQENDDDHAIETLKIYLREQFNL